MKTLICITGPLAAYKSSCALFLAKDLKLPAFMKDTFKETLCETLGARDRAENLRLSKTAVLLLETAAFSTLEAQDVALIEANFKQEELDHLVQACKARNIHLLCLYLGGSPEVLYARYLKRETSRHVAHRSAGTMTLDTFSQSVHDYERVVYPESCWRYDTETDPKLLFKAISKRLEAYLNS